MTDINSPRALPRLNLEMAAVIAMGLAWLLAACASPRPPGPAATPTCYPRPEPTGEKFIGATVEAPPPAQAAAGQVVTLTFSGAYVILNNAIVCGETVVMHMHSDEFADFSWDRTVKVFLDGAALATVECGYTCQLDVALPADVAPGAHELLVTAGFERMTFALEVSDR